MSRFLTPKYLRYHRPAGQRPVNEDRPCPGCGYNLRGLAHGRACPECGYADDENRRVEYVLTTSSEDRARWQRGLTLAKTALVVALLARVAYFIAAAPGVTPLTAGAYVGVGAVNALIWVIAVWNLTPASLGKRFPVMTGPRLVARVLALMFVPGYACLVADVYGTGQPMLEVGQLAFRLLGGAGVLFVALILGAVAEDAELDDATRRLAVAAWLLWLPTLLAQAFPSRIAWFTLVPLGFVLFFWGWIMVLFILGVRELEQHLRWARRHAIEHGARAARIAETRRAHDEKVAARIRPLPKK